MSDPELSAIACDNKMLELLNLLLEPPSDSSVLGTEMEWITRNQPRNAVFDGTSRIQAYNVTNPVTQLSWLLRDCLLAHRWPEALEIYKNLVQEYSPTLQTKWKVGCELIMADGPTGINLMNQVTNRIQQLPGVNTHQVILEFVIYLIHQGHIDDASTAIDNLPRLRKNSPYDATELQFLLKAYQGLIHYIKWSQHKQKLQDVKSNDAADIDNITDNGAELEILMKGDADRALECFSDLTDVPGIWDSFIQKHITLLDFYEKFDDAEEVLITYRNTNPQNPNAHKYLLNHYKSHNSSDDKITPILRDIASLMPSDTAVLDLVTILKTTELTLCVPLLFNFLDYHCRKNDVLAWKMLNDVLKLVRGDNGWDVVEKEWTERKTWWPEYHFDDMESQNSKLKKIKTSVARILLG